MVTAKESAAKESLLPSKLFCHLRRRTQERTKRTIPRKSASFKVALPLFLFLSPPPVELTSCSDSSTLKLWGRRGVSKP